MTGEGIFLTRGGELAVLTEQPYATEDVLQRALAEHPEVIAGPTTSDSKPGNLLLVRREMGFPMLAVPLSGAWITCSWTLRGCLSSLR